MISNMNSYLSIAQEAHEEMVKLLTTSRSPKPDGSPGHVISLELAASSFKNALITITFSAMYFEALIYVTARQRLSKTKALKIDGMRYEKRLEELEVKDQSVHKQAKALREARRELVHEKAVTPEELHSSTIRFAQEEATNAMAFVLDVRSRLAAL